MSPEASILVVHDPQRERFSARIDGRECVADYELIDGVMWLTNTAVPPALRSRGIAAELVRSALEFARAQGLKVRPACSYVRAYMRRHPDSNDLLDGSP
jgi:predicted GNAT family acetyltransferase